MHRSLTDAAASCPYGTGETQGRLGEGDTVSLQGEVSIVHDDGTVTALAARLFGFPITIRAEHLALVAKRQAAKPKRDRPH